MSIQGYLIEDLKVVCLSGALSQSERFKALQDMKNGRSKICVATDVAARGIDLVDLDIVIHADLPKNRENLLQEVEGLAEQVKR